MASVGGVCPVTSQLANSRRLPARLAISAQDKLFILAIAVAGLSIRLVALFWITPVDFRWESYHFWQIAYYSLKVGFGQGRLWDLGGLEYFWGPLPILTQSLLLGVFNTTTILVIRILNTILGTATAVVGYFVARNYFNEVAGFVAGALIAVNPILVFNSTIGMSETMGLFFLVLALAMYRTRPILVGVLLGMASLSRIELWLISIGIIFSYFLFEKQSSKLVFSLIGWLAVMAPYFLHIRGATGDPFYAFYWNFIGNIAGVWTPWYVDPALRGIFTLVLIASTAGLVILLWANWRKLRIKSYILYVVMLGFLVYHGLVYTLGGLAPLFERFFVMDLTILSILAGSMLSRSKASTLLGVCLIALIAASNVAAVPYYVELQRSITDLWGVADRIGSQYNGGTILSDMPMITYRLIDRWGVSYKEILGTLYIPYGDPRAVLEWIHTTTSSWLVVADPKGQRALNFFLEHSTLGYDKVLKLAFDFNGGSVYQIDQRVVETLIGAG